LLKKKEFINYTLFVVVAIILFFNYSYLFIFNKTKNSLFFLTVFFFKKTYERRRHTGPGGTLSSLLPGPHTAKTKNPTTRED